LEITKPVVAVQEYVKFI